MSRAFHDPGVLRHRLEIQSVSEVSDGCGGLQISWLPVAQVWGHISSNQQLREDQGQQITEQPKSRVIIRYRDDVKSGWRFSYGQRELEIHSVSDPDETRRYLVCEISEEGR